MPGLGTSLGRGGATTFPQDLVNSDCILIMGSNMAEAHPIAFANVVKAKERGAKVIHVDPHFSRTSALANLHIPTRAGSDIVFLGAIIRYLLENNAYFHEYVVHYTNAAMLVREDFKDTEDLDGLFSGFDPQTGGYTDTHSWDYQRDKYGKPLTDPTLQHPNCVFQLMRRHFARYTPEMVERVCGVPRDQWQIVAQTLAENSGRERTSAICYAVGWTQQSKGVQIIRSSAIIQLLLGNIGRPGGGIMALRGHASIQGSTDIPTLYDLLAGYMPQPAAFVETHPPTEQTLEGATSAPRSPSQQTLAEYIEAAGLKTGWWIHFPAYIKSLLKAWYGENVNEEGCDYGYRWLPKIIGDHSHLMTSYAMLDGKIKGYFLFGQNPAAGSTDSRMQREALKKLDWMVVRDLYEVESTVFWYKGTEPIDPSTIKTEVFLLPAAASTEKAGSFTNTQRLLQWRDKAVDPPGDARSDLWFVYHLGKRLKELYEGSQEAKDRPLQALTWDYEREQPEPGSRILDEPDPELVLKEINGYYVYPQGQKEQSTQIYTLHNAPHVPGFTTLKDDGSTACGSWIYSGVYPEPGNNRAASRIPDGYTNLQWGYAWPANRRILYNRASADPQGHPWSERKKYVWWDEEKKQWTGYDIPDFPLNKAPDYTPAPDALGMEAIAGSDPFIMKPDGRGWLFAPSGVKDGPLPAHYEAVEAPLHNALYKQQSNPAAIYNKGRQNNQLAAVGDERYPIVITTYRLTEHHLSGPMSRWMPWLNTLQPELFAELSPELAAERQIKHGDWMVISTLRGEIEARAMVTKRIRPLHFGKRTVHQIGVPFHWGFQGKSKGSITNDLAHMVLEPNVSIEEAKAFMCNIRPGRLTHKEL
ncbi:formate dehydrogenase-N subunit alpha [Ktedonosporobacter rubrisoli]|uniref:Formate dehydrogenase-N subunit alpha n=1 Tax=Ktedonosporobacter rubrisoli TaxID=2509675 RepID=A0A4P6K2X9_KTERU|nr:formate dehydrogenase-N subunit alpha [Ktedonosporobacter rubrisoli]